MRGLKHSGQHWAAAKARIQDQVGATMTEYAVMLAGIALTVLAGLAFLGGSVGGSFTDVVINSPLDMATYSLFDKQDCKNGGWASIEDPDNPPNFFQNQGQCVSYAVHHQ